MQIFLKFTGFRTEVLDISDSMTGLSFKEEVSKLFGFRYTSLSFAFQGKQILDSTSLSSQGIVKDSTIQVHLKLKGGGCGSSKSASIVQSTQNKSAPNYQVNAFKRGEDPSNGPLKILADAVERNDSDEALRGIQLIEEIEPESFRNPNLVAARLIEIICSPEAEGLDQGVKDRLFSYIPHILNVMLLKSDLFTPKTKCSLIEAIENSLEIIKLDNLGGPELKFNMEIARNMIQTFPDRIELAEVMNIIKDIANFGLSVFKLEVPLDETYSLGEKVFKWLRGKARENSVKSFYEMHLAICILSDDNIDELNAEAEIGKIKTFTTKDSIKVGTVLLIQKLIMKTRNGNTLNKLKDILIPLLNKDDNLLPVVLRVCIELSVADFHLKKEFQAWWETYYSSNSMRFKTCRNALVRKLIENSAASYLQVLNEDRSYLAGISYELYESMINNYDKALQDVQNVYVELSVAETKKLNDTLYDLHAKVMEFLDKGNEKVCIAFGDSGSGKSIYCHKLAQHLLTTRSSYLPIYVYLPLYRAKVQESLLKAVFKKYNIDITDELKSRRVLFIFDAYDELNSFPNIIVSNQIMETFKNCKVLFTCRTHEAPPNLNTFANFNSMGRPEKYSVLYIQPLSKENIEHYARKIVDLNIGWQSFDELWNIINRKDVLQLLSNPFLLGVCIKNPAILNNLNTQHRAISMVKAYQEYINVYQAVEYERIRENQRYKLYKMQELYTKTSIEYAFKILEKGHLSWEDISEQERELVNRGCLLKETIDSNYSFLHPSIGDYFIATGVIRIAKEWNKTHDIQQLNSFELMERYKVLDFIKEMMNECSKQDKITIQESLFNIVRLRDPKMGLASSNAISMLNHCGKSFHRQDLSGIYAKKANLRYACLMNANLNGSDLEYANLSQANLFKAQIKDCNLIGVKLGIHNRDMKHSDSITSIAVSSDNRFIASSSVDKSIKIWELDTGDLKQTIQANSGSVSCIAISSDNRLIVSGGDELSVKVWDLETGELKHTLEGHSGSILSISISSDNRFVVSGSWDLTAKVWDLETQELKHTLEGYLGYVMSVAISSDNRFIVTGAGDETIKVWELETGDLRYTLQEHSDYVSSVCISSDNRLFISGSGDNTIKVWELETGCLKNTLEGHTDYVSSICISSDNRFIVTASGDKSVKVWELETGEFKNTLQGHSGSVLSVAVSNDNRFIISGGLDMSLKVWELETGDQKHTLQGHSDIVMCIALSTDNQFLVSGGGDKLIKVWNLETGDLYNTLEGHSEYVLSLAISKNNRFIISGGGDDTIKVWELESGNIKYTLEGHSYEVNAIAISGDDRLIISGGGDKTIKVWELETGNLLKTLEGHSHGVNSLAISGDNKFIISGGEDRLIKIWELETGILKQTLQGHSNCISSLAISNNNRFILSGSWDRLLKVWDLETGDLKNTLHGHSDYIFKIAISSDDQYAISGSKDKYIKIWELETGDLKHTLQGHSSSVLSLGISSDNRFIASGGSDKSIKVWEIDMENSSPLVWSTYQGFCAYGCDYEGSKLDHKLESILSYYRSVLV